jgi:hypothetical protein
MRGVVATARTQRNRTQYRRPPSAWSGMINGCRLGAAGDGEALSDPTAIHAAAGNTAGLSSGPRAHQRGGNGLAAVVVASVLPPASRAFTVHR